MDRTRTCQVDLTWTSTSDTSGYVAYDRDAIVSTIGRPAILGSAGPDGWGDKERWSPEEMFVASIAQCHMYAYLQAACWSGVVVTAYHDEPTATVVEPEGGAGRFGEIVLRPVVRVAHPSMVDAAASLHDRARGDSLLARSLNVTVRHAPVTEAAAHP